MRRCSLCWTRSTLSATAPGKLKLAALLGELQRYGVDVFFGYGEQQDFKDASKQIAEIDQGGLGMPEKDYYLRTGDKDEKMREQYVAHVAKMLTLAGSSPEQADKDAHAIMAMETALAKASLGVVDLRDPEKTYHLQPIAKFEAEPPGVNFAALRGRHPLAPRHRDQQLNAGILAARCSSRSADNDVGDDQGLPALSPAHHRRWHACPSASTTRISTSMAAS